MVFRVTFKTPDSFRDAAEMAAVRQADDLGWERGSEEWENAYQEAMSSPGLAWVAKHFLQYGECVVIEFNTAAATARVVPAGE